MTTKTAVNKSHIFLIRPPPKNPLPMYILFSNLMILLWNFNCWLAPFEIKEWMVHELAVMCPFCLVILPPLSWSFLTRSTSHHKSLLMGLGFYVYVSKWVIAPELFNIAHFANFYFSNIHFIWFSFGRDYDWIGMGFAH